MLCSIRQVNEEFFRKFYGLKMVIGGSEQTVLCRYAKKSSYDYVEEQLNQVYPCIVIQDYVPTPKDEWYIDMHAYFGGKSSDGLTGYLFLRPIWMDFRYDVSIVAKSYNDFSAMKDYFMTHFVYGKRFIFNKKLSGEDTVGDIVPYTIRETDIPRNDGCFETNYEFTCSVWLYPRTPEEVSLIQEAVICGSPRLLSENINEFISKDNCIIITKDGSIFAPTGVYISKYTGYEIDQILGKAVESSTYDHIEKVTEKEYEELLDKDSRTLYVVIKDEP